MQSSLMPMRQSGNELSYSLSFIDSLTWIYWISNNVFRAGCGDCYIAAMFVYAGVLDTGPVLVKGCLIL